MHKNNVSYGWMLLHSSRVMRISVPLYDIVPTCKVMGICQLELYWVRELGLE